MQIKKGSYMFAMTVPERSGGSKKKGIDTKDAIREVSLKLFKEYSYEDVTIMQICKATGITKRTFYYHYNSKEELLSQFIDYTGIIAESFLGNIISQPSYIGQLWEMMKVYCTVSESYGPNIIKQVYAIQLNNKNKERFPYTAYLYDIAVTTIQNAQNAGEISKTATPENVALVLYHAFRSASFTWAAQGGDHNLSEMYRQIFETLLGLD